MNTFLEQCIFFVVIATTFFMPGALFLSAIFSKRSETFTLLEYTLFSFVVSLGLLDFGMMLFSKVHIPISRTSLTMLLVGFIFIPAFILFTRSTHKNKRNLFIALFPTCIPFKFSKKETLVIVGMFALTVFIKTVFLWNTILPTSTDLGHHMYWAKRIAIDQSIPEYAKINIDFEHGGNTLTAPEPIDDFIIGEHLPFAAIGVLTGVDFRSAFPTLFLFLVNILTVLAIAMLAFRLFEQCFSSSVARRGMIATLLLVGPLWTLSSPEAKYVSGGVIGNIIGNLLIPIIILLTLRALRKKSVAFLSLALGTLSILAFTHHLSTLIFLFILIFTGVVFVFFSHKTALPEIRSWLRLFFSPAPLITITSIILFIFFIYTPTYLDPEAIDTAIGSPSKETREGLKFNQLASSVGSARFGLELVGLTLLLFLAKTRKTLSGAVLIGWSLALIVMALFPAALFLDIPSNRISTYATFPAALLAAFALTFLFAQKSSSTKDTFLSSQISSRNMLFQWSFVIILVCVVTGGFFDNTSTFSSENNAKGATQTYAVSTWLAKYVDENKWILKDHNYITADSWMKLFFMRDYSYPLSRGFFQRYDDETKTREQCTLIMISAPNTPDAKACFEGIRTNIVVVNPHYDSAQFTKSKHFSLIYISDDIAVYKKL